MKVNVSDLEKLNLFVQSFCQNLGDRHIVLLEGPLGAGKTQFVQFLVQHYQGEAINSPSFAIHNSYESQRGDIDHIDLYRLESPDDIESTGFWDLFEKEKGLICIEWANYLNEQEIPIYWQKSKVKFHIEANGERYIEFN